MRDKRTAVEQAWALLADKTPLWTDCGALCGAKCCQGDADTGMHLLPGEEALLADTDFAIRENGRDRFCVCRGHCDRAKRPFSCRIFPFFPVPVFFRSGRYAIRVMPDLRAGAVCPLLRREDVRFDRRFLHAVKRAGYALMRDPDTRAWLVETAQEIRDVALLQEKLK
ncbi:MAG: hypothetical protein IIZ49_02170 [Oscillospiraceae bacterium]|nr:hypothetical protein [Oscillospiraceae bacterium]MBQ3880494.1 hypothetical protein [Oscillospiraceae bacterium]